MKGARVRGSAKGGSALLAGLLRGGHCGRQRHVTYCGTDGNGVRYDSRGRRIPHGADPCISFGGLRAEEWVSHEILARLQPLGIRAALEAIERAPSQTDERIRQRELSLAQARFELSRARRPYEAVDPDPRRVAAELERRCNEALRVQARREEDLAKRRAERPGELTEADQEAILGRGEDRKIVWNHAASSPQLKKRILRTLLREIVVPLDAHRVMRVLHGQGGDHTELSFLKHRTGQNRGRTDPNVEARVRELSRVMNEGAIASWLHRFGKRTAKGHPWTPNRVCALRHDPGIAVYQEGEREARGEMTLEEVARELGVSKMTVHRLIPRKPLPARPAGAGAPWIIRRVDVNTIKRQASTGSGPLTAGPNQLRIHFQ